VIKSIRGRLNQRVDILEPVKSQDEYMTETTTWQVKQWHVPCRISPVSAREAVYYFRNGVEITHRMRCVNFDIQETDRVRLGSRLFEIKGIRNLDEADELLFVQLKELK